MNILLLTLFLTSVHALGPGENCQMCRDGITTIFTNFLTPDSISWQIEVFNVTICQANGEPQACIDGITTWWPKLAEKIWSAETTNEVCHTLIGCEQNSQPK